VACNFCAAAGGTDQWLVVTDARVDSGPVLKRFQQKDRGRAHPILKRTSHISVAVDEEGTEAAAATAVVMVHTMAMRQPEQPKIFKADHPFVFFIQHRASGEILFAGRVAENLFLDKTTTGGANDFEKATEIARKMVCQWGMSDLGPLTYGERDDLIFLGRDLAVNKNFSEKTSELIDQEVKKIVTRCYDRSREILEKNRSKLKKIAKLLLEKEVLSSDEISAVAKVRKPKAPRPKPEPAVLPPAENPSLAKVEK
jgi:hypothetical protein